MAKEIETYVKLQVPAGQASPSPPVGPALGQHGVNIMDFCKSFNERTKSLKNIPKGTLLPVIIKVFADRSFKFDIKSPPVSIMLKNIMKLEKGSSSPSISKVGKITKEQLATIYENKKNDLTAKNIDQGIKTIIGTAKSMGIEVEKI